MEELWFKFKFFLVQLTHLQKRNRLRRYGFPLVLLALIFPLLIFLPRTYLELINSQTLSFLIFILLVTVASWYGGLGPGLLITILNSVFNYFTVFREDTTRLLSQDLITTFIYLIVGFLISLISEARYEAEFQKDQFIALAAHEIKNPLTVIKGYAALLQKYLKVDGRGKASGYIEEIGIQADKLLELINELLDVSKIEVGKFTYREKLFDFGSLIKKTINNQQIINSKREIILTGNTNKMIKGDSYRISQVVNNLLTNAIKYSPEKSPIKVRLKNKKGGVILIVKDYGIGIPYPEQKSIFKHFYQSKKIQRGRINGLGLGLYISAQIVERHKGKLYVKSRAGKGSTFYLELPENY